MSSRGSQIIHNKLASQLLYRLLDWRKWNELKLAEVSGILPSVISAHLSGQRPIRPQHLAAYLRVLDRQERGALLDAWLQDNVNREAIANSFVAAALAETTNFNFDLRDPSPAMDSRQGKITSQAIVKGGSGRSQAQYQGAPALRIQRTIGHEWRKLVTARKNVHSAFGRLIRDAAAPRQFKQTQRKQRRS